uniref:Uncharacterized protein n=1 Tax=Zea mays TaxID=4577 RepID=A0A804QVU1_MAIZE
MASEQPAIPSISRLRHPHRVTPPLLLCVYARPRATASSSPRSPAPRQANPIAVLLHVSLSILTCPFHPPPRPLLYPLPSSPPSSLSPPHRPPPRSPTRFPPSRSPGALSSLRREQGRRWPQRRLRFPYLPLEMHPPLTLHRHPMCAEIIEEVIRRVHIP